MDEEKWADPKREAGWQRVASAGTRPPPVAHVAILLSETLLHLQDVVNINGYLTKQMLSVGKLNHLHILHLLNIQSAHLPFFPQSSKTFTDVCVCHVSVSRTRALICCLLFALHVSAGVRLFALAARRPPRHNGQKQQQQPVYRVAET